MIAWTGRAFRRALDRTTCHEARMPFHQADDRTSMIDSSYGVAFPVTEGRTGLDVNRALVDIDACGNQMGSPAALARSSSFAIFQQQHGRPVVVATLQVAVDQFVDPPRR